MWLWSGLWPQPLKLYFHDIVLILLQECTKSRPRGWPIPYLPLIAQYDASWPPANHSWQRNKGSRNQGSVRQQQREAELPSRSRGSLKRSASFAPDIPSNKRFREENHPSRYQRSQQVAQNEYYGESYGTHSEQSFTSSNYNYIDTQSTSGPSHEEEWKNSRRLSAPVLTTPPAFEQPRRRSLLPAPHTSLPLDDTPLQRNHFTSHYPVPSSNRQRTMEVDSSQYSRTPILPPPSRSFTDPGRVPQRRRPSDYEEDFPRTPFPQTRHSSLPRPSYSGRRSSDQLSYLGSRSNEQSSYRGRSHEQSSYNDRSNEQSSYRNRSHEQPSYRGSPKRPRPYYYDEDFPVAKLHRRMSDIDDRRSDRASLLRSEPGARHQRFNTHDGQVYSDRGFTSSGAAIKMLNSINHDFNRQRNSYRY